MGLRDKACPRADLRSDPGDICNEPAPEPDEETAHIARAAAALNNTDMAPALAALDQPLHRHLHRRGPAMTVPPELAEARDGTERALADLGRGLSRLEALARRMPPPVPPPAPMSGRIVTRMSYAAEADVHRAAQALGLSVSAFGRRALAAAAAAVNAGRPRP
jgi:hypothetical protein